MKARSAAAVFSSFALAAGALLGCAADAPPPPPRPAKLEPPPPSVAPAVKLCTMLASCAQRGDRVEVRDPVACVARALSLQSSDVVLGCVQNARSCVEVDACLGRDRTDEARRLCESKPDTIVFCDGARFVSCEGDRPDVVNCAEVGGTCRELRVASGIVLRGCFSSKLCGDGAPPSRCDGESRVVTCQEGLAERTRCPTGTRCEERPNGEGAVEARCRPVGARPCVPGGVSRCDGNTLVTCMAGEDGRGALVETDCAASGLACATSGRDAACIAGNSCQLGPAWCDQGALRFCASGAPVRVRCEAFGLGPCEMRDGIASCKASR